MLDSLPSDTLLKIAEELRDDPVSLIRLGLTCRDARVAASQLTHGVRFPGFYRWNNKTQLRAKLLLSRQELCQLPFQVRRVHAGRAGTMHLTDMCTLLPKLLELFGGWAELSQRLNSSFSKKRKFAEMRASNV